MKKSLILLLLAAVLLSLTGCKKDNEKSGPSGETVTLSATLGGGEKTEIDGFDMKWSAGDAVNINGTPYTAKFDFGYETATFDNVTSADTYKAYYPADLYQSGKYVLPATQTYAGNTLSLVNPMYAVTTTKTLQFHNICALVKLQVTGTGTVKQIVVTSTDNLCGEFEVQPGANDRYYAHITGSGNTVTLNCGAGVTLKENEATTFYIALPQGELGNLTFKCSGDADEWEATPITTANLTAGKLYTKSLENVEIIEFTVGMDGDTPRKVKFAPGNLWYDGSAFHFETNQWGFEDSWNSSHVSHFKWSDKDHAVTSDYSYNDDLFCNNNFTVTGDSHTDWRTLSRAEWSYLIGESSPGRAQSLCEWSAVTFGASGPTVNGLIIMPDGWEGTLNETTDYTTWQSLASSGAVFLPAAGFRGGTNVLNVGSYGDYWSSTPYGSSYAYSLYFSSGSVYTYNGNRYGGLAVRLVR